MFCNSAWSNSRLLQILLSFILLYADNTVLFTPNKCPETIEREIRTLVLFVPGWKLNDLVANLNKGKTEFVLYGTPKLSTAKKLHVHITMNENKINEGDQYEYLGAIMDKNLNYKNYIEKTQKKVSDRMKLLHG